MTPDYSCSSANTTGREKKQRAATPAAAEQVYHCLGALSWLVGPLTWNVLMRQSGVVGAWQLAAGRDNLLRAKHNKGLLTILLKPWRKPPYSGPRDADGADGFSTALPHS